MVPLPIDPFLPEIVARVREDRSLVLVAEPGAGKTTRVPPAILRGGVLSGEHPVIVVLQPRRVAARTVAARIADENGWPLGGPVGYHVRFDRRIGPDTRLRVVTEGILTRQLLDDPFLEGVGCVVLDEFHERSLYTDVAIALLREVQQTVRPDLCIVVMSATLEAGPVAAYLGGCGVVRVPGRTYPVAVSYEADEAPLPSGWRRRSSGRRRTGTCWRSCRGRRRSGGPGPRWKASPAAATGRWCRCSGRCRRGSRTWRCGRTRRGGGRSCWRRTSPRRR